MGYVGRRLLHALLLLFAVSFLSFVLLGLAPGDYFDQMRLNPEISEQTIGHLRAYYALDRPLLVRYEHWLCSTVDGQMGFSLAYHEPVWPILRVRARNTLLLTGTATSLAWLLALPLGIWAAVKRDSWGDYVGGVATSAVLTIPDLVLFLALLLFALRTGWFPVGGMESPRVADQSFWSGIEDTVHHLVLPALGLALVTFPVLFRHVRSTMIETLESPFIQAARAHGIPRTRLLFRYALPVAANPLISLFGLSVATMLSSSLLMEVILSWPGLGPLLVESILSRDTYVVIGGIILSSVFLIVGNLLADLLIFASDPRVRVE
jgi:peptide/nickel transport system permease protein